MASSVMMICVDCFELCVISYLMDAQFLLPLFNNQILVQQDSKIANGLKVRDNSGIESSFRAGSTKVIGRSTGKEFAATRIQTAYRSYRARKMLRCLKGTSRFQALVEADALTKQASSALDKIHFWSRIQTEIKSRRYWMAAESRIKQKKLENRVQVESKLHELEWRANPNRYFGQAYYDLSKESWGWSWKERWIAVCPWEARVVARPVGKQNKASRTTKHGAPKIVVAVFAIAISNSFQ
ncbi:IQ motif, EF-hand binding site-containing protein [Cynara cardunculus var. scolymus]|uniref:IQ motif, EF-hand binding site-containing protein n=1 Tax=Cynara cardunculus var. scolymus TaxID=59895 RepID=A0A103YJW7_CYNCS|nr:IQ motif, EF-hand binding site-containing protein [Cynara cardunculus var. scolymus]